MGRAEGSRSMTVDDYPKDRKYYSRDKKGIWALHVIRLLCKTGAAHHIGRDAAWLITTIATSEDVKGYTGPVGFWNPHLMDATGFGSKQTFLKARKAAVDAGWLAHIEGRKGLSAKYWTLMPESARQFIGDDIHDELAGPDMDQQVDQQTECRSRSGPVSGPVSGPHSSRSPSRSRRERGASLPSHSKTTFIKPTVAEVKAYAADQSQANFDGAKFIDYYESNGWKVGRTAMKDWHATVRNWIRNGGTQAKGKASSNTDTETAWQNILDALETHGRYDDGPGKIRSQIGERAWQALSKIGLKKLDEATPYDHQQLKSQFAENFTQRKEAA